MMIGLGTLFKYFECKQCGCLQIINPPDDLAKYYPRDYYSLKEKQQGSLARFLRKQRARSALGLSNYLGKLLTFIYGKPDWTNWFSKLDLNLDTSILDVGCGNGVVLKNMYHAGFTNLTGIDPFLDKDISIDKSFNIYKREVTSLEGSFDFIMLNHVLEHMPDQPSTMIKLNELLSPNGILMIRIPITGTYAWNTFGTNWVQLDAPRHFYLHTLKSFSLLSEKTNFEIIDTIFDSTTFQITGSLGYQNDIPLKDQKPISKNKLKDFKHLVKKLNENKEGDQAIFYLKKRA